MELYHLKTFVKVADEGNLTRASEALFASQPAISAHIKALEDELGVVLFSRTPKGMSLTPSGELLYQQAKQTLDSAEQFKQHAQQLRNELVGELKVGVHTDFGFMRIGPLFQQLTQQHAQLKPHFLQSSSVTVVQELRRGSLDGGFMFGPCNAADIAIYPIQQVPMVVVVPAIWKEQVEHATLADLCEMPWIFTSSSCPFYHISEQLFAEQAVKPKSLAFADTEEAVRELLKSQVGVALLRLDDAELAEQQGYAVCWRGVALEISLQFVILKQRQKEPVVQAFVESMYQVWQLPEEALMQTS